MFIPGVTTIFNLDNGRLSTYPYYTVPRWGKTAQGSCPVHQLWRLCDTWLGLQSPAHWANILVIGVSVPPYHRLSDSATGFAIFLPALLSLATAHGDVASLPRVQWQCDAAILGAHCVTLPRVTLSTHTTHQQHVPWAGVDIVPTQGCILSPHKGGCCPHTGVDIVILSTNTAPL